MAPELPKSDVRHDSPKIEVSLLEGDYTVAEDKAPRVVVARRYLVSISIKYQTSIPDFPRSFVDQDV